MEQHVEVLERLLRHSESYRSHDRRREGRTSQEVEISWVIVTQAACRSVLRCLKRRPSRSDMMVGIRSNT